MARTETSTARQVMKVRSGDRVHVIAGKDRGKSGRVLRVEPKRGRVVVEGMNMVKRHVRPTQADNQAMPGTAQQLGGVIESEGSIHVSNVMLADPKDGKPTRVGIERENGKAYRVAKRSGTRLD
jgi:large subunit ribosomal protein L24